MQGVWICDAPFVSLLLQEVKEVFDCQRGPVWRDAEDSLKEVIQELLKSSLWRKRVKAALTYTETWFCGMWTFLDDSRGLYGP